MDNLIRDDILAFIFGCIFWLPVVLYIHGKYRKMFDGVWKINSDKERMEAIEEIKGYAVPIAIGCGLIIVFAGAALVVLWGYLTGQL